MKQTVQPITASDLRVTYTGDYGRIKLIPTARSWAAWWIRHRLPYHLEGLALYFQKVSRGLRTIEWQNR